MAELAATTELIREILANFKNKVLAFLGLEKVPVFRSNIKSGSIGVIRWGDGEMGRSRNIW